MQRPQADLQGDLSVFAPELLFQMMSLAHSTGVLTIRQRRREVRVIFREGQLLFASGEVGRKARLGDVLVRVGRLKPAERTSAVRAWRKAEGDKRLGAILVERGLLAPAELEGFVQEQVKELIVEVLRWKSGTFAFRRARADDEDIVLDVQLDSLLLECMTRLDHEGKVGDDDS